MLNEKAYYYWNNQTSKPLNLHKTTATCVNFTEANQWSCCRRRWRCSLLFSAQTFWNTLQGSPVIADNPRDACTSVLRFLYEQRMICTVSQKNNQNYFSYNYVKFPRNLIIFRTKMAKRLKLYKVHSFSTSPDSRQCTTVVNKFT